MAKEKRIIDANVVKSIIIKVMAENNSEELFIKVAEHICKMLDYAPTVDAVEVVHGRWEIREIPGQVDTYGRPCKLAACTHCGFTWTDLYSVKNYFKHCPGCGADMVKREENANV